MLSLALLLSVAAAEPLKVLVLDLSAESVSTSTASLVRDEITVALSRDERLEVLSTEDVRRAVSVEAEKMSAGCSDASCLAEIGQALGARYVVHGSVGVLGSTTIVHISLFDSDASRAVARETVEAKTPDDLLPNVRTALDKIRFRMLGAAPVAAAPVAAAPVGGAPALGTIVGGSAAAVGVAGLVAGGLMMGLAWPTFDDRTPPADGGPSPDDRLGARALGQAGTVVAVAGVVVAGAGAGAFFLLE